MTTVVLVQAKPRIAATGATVDVRVAGGGSRAYDQLGFGDWRGGVATVPRMSAAIGFDAGGFTSRTLPSTASLRIFPSDKAYASYLGGLVWDKAAITVRMGDDETATTYPVVLAGTVSSAVSEGGAITLTVSDLSVSLDTPIASKTFAGTGDLEGGDDATGRVKRVAFGQVFNVEGFLLDKANSIYEFGDPSVQNAVTAISAVRDKGLAGPLVTVAWQGSAAATLTSLRNTAAPQGGAVIAPSIACVKWWTTPVGPLTADLTGRVAQNTRPANLAAMVAGQYATGITVTNLAEAEAWAPYASGILISDSNETAAQAIDRLLNPLLMAWTVDGAGALTFRRFNLTAPTVTLTADTVKREVMFPPLRTRRVGFQRNNRVHSAAEISAAILATDVLFPDGTTGADLQITVGQILDTIDAIVSDGILSRGEKPPEIIRWQQSHDQLNALNQKYVTLGSPPDLTATRDSANASVSALDTYLGSLSPVWNDTTVDTPIDGPTYRQKWRDALSTLEGFTAAITGRKGADGASAFTLLNVANTNIIPGVVTKAGGGEEWNGKAMIREGDQSVTVSGLLIPGTFIALTTDPGANASYDTLDYALHWSNDTGLFLFRNNAAVKFANRALDAGSLRVTIQKKGDTIIYLVDGYTAPASHPANATGEVVYAAFAIYRTGDAIRGITYSVDGNKGDKGDKGDTVIGPQGPPPFGFVQDDNPGPGQFDRQTWYRPTSKEYYYWLNGAWNKVGGDLFSQNLITSSAQIADALIISAKIKDLEVDTIKIRGNAVTNSVTKGGLAANGVSDGATVETERVSISSYGGTMVILVQADGRRTTGSGVMVVELMCSDDRGVFALSRQVAFSPLSGAVPVFFYSMSSFTPGVSPQFWLRFSATNSTWNASSGQIAITEYKR